MVLFTIAMMTTEEQQVEAVINGMTLEFAHLHNDQNGVRLTHEIHAHFSEIQCIGSPGFRLPTDSAAIFQTTASALARYIIQEEEMRTVRRLITHEYDYKDRADVTKIEKYCLQFLNGNENYTVTPRRQLMIEQELYAYLELNTYMNINGFIRFRLNHYMNELREIVEYAIDEFLMDKQYQDFISLLKYFVVIQESKIPIAHLMHKGGHEFTLLNEHLIPIDTRQFDNFTVELLDKDINFEDMIVSTLITVSPEQINIHTREPELQVIKTIMQIFEERANVCSFCALCKPMFGEVKQHDQR